MKKIFVVLLAICSLQLMSNDINWTSPPDLLSSADQNASNAQIAMDANGNAVAVWIESGLVKSKSKLANMGWSGASATLSGMGSSSPVVVSDSNGNATAVWVENGLIKASSKTLAGNWNVAVTLSGKNAASPSLAVSIAGDVVAAWVRTGDVQTSTKLFGGNWQNAVTINAVSSALPQVAIGGSGSNITAVVVWQAVASSINVVYASNKPIAGSWSTKQVISNTLHQAGYAHVAVDANANATAVWYSYDVVGSNYSEVTVQSATRLAGGSWGSIASISESGIRNPATLVARVAYDGLGNAIALWTHSFDNETYTIQSAINPIYFDWKDPIDLVQDSLYSYQADLAVATLGDALSLYMFYNGSALLIQSSELDITGFMDSFWSVPINIAPGTQNAYPEVAATLTGNAINTAAVWISSNGMYNSVFASVGTKSLVLPPSNLIVTQNTHNFGVFTEYYNTLSWQASTDPAVVGYIIYRNGVFLEQVSSNVLQIIDDNKVQNGPVTYGVASVDNQNTHSQIMTVSFP